MELFKISLLACFITLLQAFITAGETVYRVIIMLFLLALMAIIALHNTVLLCSKMLRRALWSFQQPYQTAVVVTVLLSGALSSFLI